MSDLPTEMSRCDIAFFRNPCSVEFPCSCATRVRLRHFSYRSTDLSWLALTGRSLRTLVAWPSTTFRPKRQRTFRPLGLWQGTFWCLPEHDSWITHPRLQSLSCLYCSVTRALHWNQSISGWLSRTWAFPQSFLNASAKACALFLRQRNLCRHESSFSILRP